MTPQISIIIALYNQANYIPDAIDSVLAQTASEWELIVVDDGSSDESATVVSRYADPRIRLVQQVNLGLPGARNTGIRHATGRYIAFLDADDWLHPDCLQALANRLAKDDAVGLAFGTQMMVSDAGEALYLRRSAAQLTLRNLLTSYPIPVGSFMLRRQWLEHIWLGERGPYDESYRSNSEDRNWGIRLAMAGCMMQRVDVLTSYRRIHSGRSFRAIPTKLETYFRALDTAFDDPRCPADLLTLKPELHAEHYVNWGCQAAMQGESKLAQELLTAAQPLDESWFSNGGLRLERYLSHVAARTIDDPLRLVDALLAALPACVSHLRQRREAIIGRTHLLIAIRELLWARKQTGAASMTAALHHNAMLDQSISNRIVHNLIVQAVILGSDDTVASWQVLHVQLARLTDSKTLRQLTSAWRLGYASERLQAGQPRVARHNMLQALKAYPASLRQRSVRTNIFRSLLPTA